MAAATAAAAAATELVSSDPYEQKLYQMFSSHDVAGTGSLDAAALVRLCHTLDLKDREALLVETCVRNAESLSGRVTFKGFKDGLLTLLGDGGPGGVGGGGESEPAVSHSALDADKSPAVDPTNISASTANPTTSSPSREVSPKYVVAGKKYGRRSRPASGAFEDMPSGSDSDADEATTPRGHHAALRHHHHPHDQQRSAAQNAGAQKATQKVQRSSSHSELHGEPRKRRPTSGQKLKRCASLPAQPKPFKRDDAMTMGAPNTLSANASTAMIAASPGATPMMRESSVESLGNLDFENLSHSLYDVWSDHGHATNNYLNRAQLELVCEQVGLHGRIASKVAEEVFEKLGLDGNSAADTDDHAGTDDRVCFADFIALIQSDTDTTVTLSANASASSAFGGSVSGSALLLSELTQTSATAAVTLLTAVSPPAEDFVSGGLGGMDSGLSTSKESNDSPLLLAGHSSDDWPVESSAVPSEVIVDMWDTAGIPNPRSLLDTLGFRSKEIRISQLSLAIEDDLQTMPAGPESRTAQTLLRASLALHKAEVNALQLAFRQLATQNRKLHASNRDTNRRAALLAQEVDERHTHLENAARQQIQHLEQRHTDAVRDLTAQMAADREQLTTYAAQLEQRNKVLEADDARMRLQCQLAVEETGALETELIAVQRQCTDLLEENIRLNNTIVEVDERQRADDTRKGDRESEELLELMEKVSSLQLENANLRDKNDELVSEVEEKLVELTRMRGKKPTADLGADAAAASAASATKRRGDSPSKTKICEESPKLGKLRKCSNESDDGAAAAVAALADQSDHSGDWMALNAELSQSAAAAAAAATAAPCDPDQTTTVDSVENSDDTIAQLRQRIVELQERLQQASEAGSHNERIVELETSLEQMRKEFEDLEDYWQGKLNDERQLFEMEQQKSNEKFDELLKKMAEYEEQFVAGMEKAAHSRLSPIEERDVLEQQYLELEDELEELREQARTALDHKDEEIETLQEKLKRLQHRLVEDTAAASSASTATTSSLSLSPPVLTTTTAPSTSAEVNVHHDMPSLGGISCRSVDADSPASSPISYLWSQSTIQAPARDYQNPNWGSKLGHSIGGGGVIGADAGAGSPETIPSGSGAAAMTPIQRPNTPSQHSAHSGSSHGGDNGNDKRAESASESSSVHSYGAPSVASTFNIRTQAQAGSSQSMVNPAQVRDELKRLKLVEMKLRHDIQELVAQRDYIVGELQQLQEFRPAMERSAYARSNHPNLMQRNCALEQRIRALELCLKNQHQYNETMMQQTCVQHNSVVSVLHSRIEEQQAMINDQATRLVNNDLFAKDMFVENSQLGDLLEQQRMCNTRLRQHHQQI